MICEKFIFTVTNDNYNYFHLLLPAIVLLLASQLTDIGGFQVQIESGTLKSVIFIVD